MNIPLGRQIDRHINYQLQVIILSRCQFQEAEVGTRDAVGATHGSPLLRALGSTLAVVGLGCMPALKI